MGKGKEQGYLGIFLVEGTLIENISAGMLLCKLRLLPAAVGCSAALETTSLVGEDGRPVLPGSAPTVVYLIMQFPGME